VQVEESRGDALRVEEADLWGRREARASLAVAR
jgi:hypothetical protein